MAATLILRTVQGTPLTNIQVDNNFSNLSTFANTVDANIGVLSALTTTNQSNIVFSVNELKSNIGVLSALTTTGTSNLVSAVNSIKSGNLSQFGTTTSADLISVLSDETGTGSAVFGTEPTISLPIINNIKQGYTSTATAAGTTTLTSASNFYQRFTGSTTQTVVLPVTSTLAQGVAYEIENASTGNLTVNSSGGNLVVTVVPGVTVQCRCIGTSLTTAADWDPEYNEFASITGTGNVVLSSTNAITLAGLTYTMPHITANVGYMEVPQNSQSAAYTCVLSDTGKHIFHPSSDANARTYTIPANSSVSYPVGTVIAFINMTSQVVSIAITTDTMYLGGLGTTGTRSLAQYGVANATKITSTSWIITGTGLT